MRTPPLEFKGMEKVDSPPSSLIEPPELIRHPTIHTQQQLLDLKYGRKCCFGRKGMTDDRLLKYLIQTGTLVSILIFSMVMLAKGDDTDGLYTKILFMIMGVLIPNPKI